jgi:hypothetical protein
MPWVGFEPTIPAFEQVKKVQALDRGATVIGIINMKSYIKLNIWRRREGRGIVEWRIWQDPVWWHILSVSCYSEFVNFMKSNLRWKSWYLGMADSIEACLFGRFPGIAYSYLFRQETFLNVRSHYIVKWCTISQRSVAVYCQVVYNFSTFGRSILSSGVQCAAV